MEEYSTQNKQKNLKIEQKSMNFLQKENRTQDRKAMKQEKKKAFCTDQERSYTFSYIRG